MKNAAMKKILSMILIAVLTATLFCAAAVADTNVTGILLGAKGAALRDAPNGTKIASIHRNTYLPVIDEQNGWYLVSNNGQTGWVAYTQVAQYYCNDASDYTDDNTSYTGYGTNTGNGSQYTGYGRRTAPYIGSRVYSLDSRDSSINWVQTHLKATGIWYQGDQWLVTGHLGKHTMEEIRSFMQYMGYPYHTGVVDQNVIDALCEYLGIY